MILRSSLALVRGCAIHADVAHVGWDVFLGTQKLDTVFYNRSCTAQYVRTTLINHDKHDPNIVVRRSK
jgi:hypothetical protein